MKTTLSLLAILLCCSEVQAQNVEGQIIAAQYGEFKVASQNTGSFQFPSATCQVSGGGKNFEAFAAGRAVKIVDSNPNLTEVSTPSSAFQDPCVVNMTTSFTHVPPYYLTSGTGGLQEAITANQQGIAGANSVILNSEWYSLIKPRTAATVIGSVQGNINMPLIDITTAPYNYYTWNGSQYVIVPNAAGQFLPITGGTISGPLFGPNINGEIYPASCGDSSPPGWCTGTTADAWIRAACTQLPDKGGIINLLGLNGTIAASVPCSTPTKQVIMLADNTSRLDVSVSDGSTVFPLDNNSMLIGQGAGQCNQAVGGTGIRLTGSANITSIVGPAHTDGTQEAFTAQGLCLEGATGATVSKGLLYSKATFVNTTFSGNNVAVCNTACLWMENMGGIVEVNGNEFNVTDGDISINGSAIDVVSSVPGGGCGDSSIDIHGGNAEHANGGANFPEINIHGDGAGALACSVYVHDLYTERNFSGTPSTAAIRVQDCFGCSFTNIQAGGGAAISSGDMISLSSTALGRVQNVMFDNINNILGQSTWLNTLNDTTPGGQTLVAADVPYIATYFSNPGYQQAPDLPQSTLQSLAADLMSGQGSLATGSGTFGANFIAYGCQSGQGITCVYTRTNSTAPSGYTFSQQVQITSNTDPAGGDNGIEFTPSISFSAGTKYQVSFWMKGDGTYTGLPLFILGDPTVPTQYCSFQATSPLTTAWQLFTAICTPTASGSSFLSFSTLSIPAGATGTFWIAGMIFAPVTPLTPGNLLTSVTPYGIGPASDAQKTISINSTPCELGGSCSVGGGSGTVNAAAKGQSTYYAADGTAVSGVTTGLIVPPSGDTTGATDGVNIAAACMSSGSVQLAAGTYHVGASNTTISLTAPCKIQGAGKSTVITNHSTTSDVFRISYFTVWVESPWAYPTSTDQTELSGFQIVQAGGVTPTAGYGFNIGSGIAQAGGTFSYTMNVHVHDVVMNSLWGGFNIVTDELYTSIDNVMGRNFVGGGCINYNAEVGSGDNHFGPNLECSGLTNSGIIIAQSDVQHFLGVKLNGSGISFTGAGATKSVIFDDVSVETGISQPCMMDFGTGSAPVNVQFNNSEQYGFATAFCHPTNVSGLAFAFNNSLATSDYSAGLITNNGYTSVSATYQDYATFVGTVGTALSSYTTQAGKTFALYTADGVTPQAMPVLTGAGAEKINGGGNSFGDVLDTLTPTTADYTVSETFTLAASTDQTGIFGRANSAANTNYVFVYGGTGFLDLYSQVAGTAVQLAQISFTWSPGATHTMSLKMVGSTISAMIDGSNISGSPVTNSAVTAKGQAGSRVYAGATGTNFNVQ